MKMGIEFIEIFEDWAKDYDASVQGFDPQYADVFSNYEAILNEVVSETTGTVLEFGVGTGNLSKKIMQAGHPIVGVEPSKAMREIALEKFPTLTVLEGDFITFPPLNMVVDTIVSTYAFHHLTDAEKATAVQQFRNILAENGKIVFGDTMFKSVAMKEKAIDDANEKGFLTLAEDLQREYYPTIDTLQTIFIDHGFDVNFKQMNNFVWIVIAKKR